MQHCSNFYPTTKKEGKQSVRGDINYYPMTISYCYKLAKLGDAIAISKSETNNGPLTDPLTDGGNC